MSMTVAVTRNLPGRFRGFLASCMLEAAPGVYVQPDMSAAVRERVWQVMCRWNALIPDDGGLVMLWRNPEMSSGLSIQMLGWPKKELLNYDGVWLSVREAPAGSGAGEGEAAEPGSAPT